MVSSFSVLLIRCHDRSISSNNLLLRFFSAPFESIHSSVVFLSHL